MKLHELFENFNVKTVDIDAEIKHAAAGLGTLDELTPYVMKKIHYYLDHKSREINLANEAELESMIYKAKKENDKGQTAFALKIAMVVLGVRIPNLY